MTTYTYLNCIKRKLLDTSKCVEVHSVVSLFVFLLLVLMQFGQSFRGKFRIFFKDCLYFDKYVTMATKISISDILLKPQITSYLVIYNTLPFQ